MYLNKGVVDQLLNSSAAARKRFTVKDLCFTRHLSEHLKIQWRKTVRRFVVHQMKEEVVDGILT